MEPSEQRSRGRRCESGRRQSTALRPHHQFVELCFMSSTLPKRQKLSSTPSPETIGNEFWPAKPYGETWASDNFVEGGRGSGAAHENSAIIAANLTPAKIAVSSFIDGLQQTWQLCLWVLQLPMITMRFCCRAGQLIWRQCSTLIQIVVFILAHRRHCNISLDKQSFDPNAVMHANFMVAANQWMEQYNDWH